MRNYVAVATVEKYDNSYATGQERQLNVKAKLQWSPLTILRRLLLGEKQEHQVADVADDASLC
jgi:hypothetical protein